MDKATQLNAVLDRLSPQQATELARAAELNRALGRQDMPSTAILEGLRPMLRATRPPRVPTLQRLICVGLEDFLSDRTDDPRLEGLVPRSSLAPWWQAAKLLAGGEIEALEARLGEQLAAAAPNLETLQHEAQEAAAGWSTAIIAELAKPKPSLALRKLVPELIARDIDMIAHMLTVVRPLGAAMKSLHRVAGRLGLLEGRRLTDLAPDCVTLLKQQYQALSESHGMDARFLPLAALNRLLQPRQILRLGRALSWKPNDSLVANTELFCVGARLIGEVERLARSVLQQMPRRGPLPSPAALGMALMDYLDESEGVLSEIGVRRDSPWGTAILQTRSDVAHALDSDFLDRFAELVRALLPLAQRPAHGPDLSVEPSRETIAWAREAAGFLKLLCQRGQRHGFAKPAFETIDGLAADIEERITGLCEAARVAPESRAAIEAQARAAAEICDELFDDARSTTIIRRVAAALRATAA
ncbi:MAG TPA: hypothetical protein VGP48_12485 [Stellaceae bacterium]|jgi:hypothetical protein|nr:hypothetical protein [Stellaceae bacterium]